MEKWVGIPTESDTIGIMRRQTCADFYAKAFRPELSNRDLGSKNWAIPTIYQFIFSGEEGSVKEGNTGN